MASLINNCPWTLVVPSPKFRQQQQALAALSRLNHDSGPKRQQHHACTVHLVLKEVQ